MARWSLSRRRLLTAVATLAAGAGVVATVRRRLDVPGNRRPSGAPTTGDPTDAGTVVGRADGSDA